MTEKILTKERKQLFHQIWTKFSMILISVMGERMGNFYAVVAYSFHAWLDNWCNCSVILYNASKILFFSYQIKRFHGSEWNFSRPPSKASVRFIVWKVAWPLAVSTFNSIILNSPAVCLSLCLFRGDGDVQWQCITLSVASIKSTSSHSHPHVFPVLLNFLKLFGWGCGIDFLLSLALS